MGFDGGLVMEDALKKRKRKKRRRRTIFILFLVLAAAAVTRWVLEFGFLVLAEAFIAITGLVFLYGSSEEQTIPISHGWRLVRMSSLVTLALIGYFAEAGGNLYFKATLTLFATSSGTQPVQSGS